MPSLFTTAILAVTIFTTLISAQSTIPSDLPSLPGPSGIHGGPPTRSTATVLAPTDISTILGVTGRLSTTSTATATDISTVLGVTGSATSNSVTTSATKVTGMTTITSDMSSTSTDVPTLLGPTVHGGPGKYSSITSSVASSTSTTTASTSASTSASAASAIATTTTTQLQTSTSASQPAASTSLKPYAGGAARLGAEIAGVGMIGALVLLVIQ